MNAVDNIKFDLRLPIGMSRRGEEWIDFASPTTTSMLVGGATGSGKSTFLRQLITYGLLVYGQGYVDCRSINYDMLRFYLIDLKRVEFTPFNLALGMGVEYVATDLHEAVSVVDVLEHIVDSRYKEFSRMGYGDVDEYNEMCVRSGDYDERFCHIILVIDELAELAPAYEPVKDLKKVKEIFHGSVNRLTRLGRASGVHTIAATQRPDMYAVPGYIKANLVTTVAFKTRSSVDSEILLGSTGASGGADKLPLIPGRGILGVGSELIEFQAPHVSADKVKSLLGSYRDMRWRG